MFTIEARGRGTGGADRPPEWSEERYADGMQLLDRKTQTSQMGEGRGGGTFGEGVAAGYE